MALSPNSSALQSADLNTLLRINKSIPIYVTYKGNDAMVYQHALSSYFTHHPLTWKRNGKFFSSPLSFHLTFVAFDETRVFNLDSSLSQIKDYAFVHMFFINVSSADEYRTSVRHTVSEWFAALSARPELQWLIVVDSTRAKERKSRTNLMDKIKQDFSKHQHKLIEVSESIEHGSFTGLSTAVQASFLAHLDLLMDTSERCLKSMRERYPADDWSLVEYVNSELDYVRLFWSLGAHEHCLKLVEDLDSFVVQLLLSLELLDTLPPWATRLAEKELEGCPSLLESMSAHQAGSDQENVAGIRHVILAQKLLLTLHMYHAKLHNSKTVSSPGARCDYSAVLIKYSSNVLKGVIEHIATLRATMSPFRFSCWIVQLVGEAFYISCLLADVATVEVAKDAVCFMHSTRFEALMHLATLSEAEADEETTKRSREDILGWLDGILARREDGTKLSKKHRDSALALISSSLRSPSSLESSLLRAHDAASSFLTQSGRMKTAAFMGRNFAAFLTRNGKKDMALPYVLRFVTQLMADFGKTREGGDECLVVAAVREALGMLHEKHDYDRIIRFLVFLVDHEKDEQRRRADVEKLVGELERGTREALLGIRILEWKKSEACPLRVRLSDAPERMVPGETYRMRVAVSYPLLGTVTVPACTVRVRLKRLSALRRDDLSRRPAFDIDSRLSESRLLCVHKGSLEALGSPRSAEEPGQGGEMELTHEGTTLTIGGAGETEVEVSMKTTEAGIFTLVAVEVSLSNEALTLGVPLPSLILPYSRRRKPFLVTVEQTKHAASLRNSGVILSSGVSESLVVVLSSGTVALPRSQLRISVVEANDNDVEFRSEDGLWENIVVLNEGPMEKEQSRERRVRLCLPVEDDARGAADREDEEITRKIRLEWEGETSVHIVRFTPLFRTRLVNSHLENRILLDLEMSRSPSSSQQWHILPREATLKLSVDCGLDMRLLYFDEQALLPSGVTSFTWLASQPAPPSTPPNVHFSLRITYGVAPSDGRALSVDEDRTYEYRLDGDVEMKQVEYEVCSQVLSQQPGAQLCRVGSPCHLMVSVRSLFRPDTDSLYIQVVADERLWDVQERMKAFTLKESGLGQVSMVVVPLVPGFLPFPSVQLYNSTTTHRSEDRFWPDSSEIIIGPPLFVFERTAGKQIRVLGASQSEGSLGSRGGGRKKLIKTKIMELFDSGRDD